MCGQVGANRSNISPKNVHFDKHIQNENCDSNEHCDFRSTGMSELNR